MSTHNICLYNEVKRKYTGCNLKTAEFLDCVLIGLCAVIRSVYCSLSFEPAQDKTYNKTGVPSKDNDQPVHPSSMARVLVYLSLDSPEAVEDTCYQ